MITFPQILIAVKTFSSKWILKVGYGVTFIFALAASIFLGINTNRLYEVPYKDVQLYVSKVYGGDEKDYSIIEFNMDYGLNITSKYRENYKPGVELYIYQTENWRTNDSIREVSYGQYNYWAVEKTFDFDPVEINKFLREREIRQYGDNYFMDKILSIYDVTYIESKLPRTSFKDSLVDTFQVMSGYTGEIVRNHVVNRVKKLSGRYLKSFLDTDTITGLESYMVHGYTMYTDSGTNMGYSIPGSLSLTKPDLCSLFDISQSYFRFTINIPAEIEGAELLFDFGGATEFSNIFPEPDVVSMSTLKYTDLNKIKYIGEQGLWLHAKFKQMENIQILRMFVMTTLLGFMVALMFSSLCKGLKSASRRYRIKRKKEEEEKQAIKEKGTSET